MNRARPWLVAGAYLLMVGVGVGVGYFYWSLRVTVPAVSTVVLTAWCIWLTMDRRDIIEFAEQAADDANRAQGQYDTLADQVYAITEHLRAQQPAAPEVDPIDDQRTEPIPIVQPPTVPMSEAWDSSAAELGDKTPPEELHTRMHTREFSGRAFNFRS